MPPTRIRLTLRHALAVLAAAVLFAPAHGAEYALGEGRLSVSGSIYAGTAIRTVAQDPTLLPNVNSSVVGIEGEAINGSTGRNQDDGNLNFNRGDPVATVLKGYLALKYAWRTYGIEATGQGWYDYTTADAGHPWGNLGNGFAANKPLGDAGALPRSKFSGLVLDTLYAYGHHPLDGRALDWRLGYQTLDWGKRFIVLGGLRELNPLDLPAALRPGALREQETRIAIPAAYARFDVSTVTSLEAFYQLHFEPTALNQCGTFYSSLDFMAEHCDKAMFGNLSDRTAIATGFYIKRTETLQPSNGGQGGLALRHKVPAWSTEFGLYAAQFHSRVPYYSGTKSLRAGAPFIPGDPGNLNPTYFSEYPEDIQMFGATFESKLRLGLVFGELTYRPNQPFQYNSVDVLAAAISRTAPTPLRAQMDAVAPGASLHGWERHEALQLQRRTGLQAGTRSPGSGDHAIRSVGSVRPGTRRWRVPTARRGRFLHLRWLRVARRVRLPLEGEPAIPHDPRCRRPDALGLFRTGRPWLVDGRPAE
jgi:hypothetical protein